MPDFTNLLSSKFKSSSDLCRSLLEETGVAVLPGSDFGFPKEKLLFRLGFVDFDGSKLLKASQEELTEDFVLKNASKVMDGIDKIIEWSQKHS